MKFLCGLLIFAISASLITPSHLLYAQRGVQSNGDLITSFELLVKAHRNKLPNKWNLPIGFSSSQKKQWEILFRDINSSEIPLLEINDSKIVLKDRDNKSTTFSEIPISISMVVYPNHERAFLINSNGVEAVWRPSGDINEDYKTIFPFLKKTLIKETPQNAFFKLIEKILPTAEANALGVIAVIAVVAAVVYACVHMARKVGSNLDKTGDAARRAIDTASKKANDNIDKVGDSAKKVSDAAANTLNSTSKVLDESAATIAEARNNTVNLNSGGVVLSPTSTH